MIVIYYLYILAPFAALFALGYFPTTWLGRLLTKRRLAERADIWAPVTGVLGTVTGFLFFGWSGFDRFALAPDHVRMTWQTSGSAFVFELLQAPFNGGVCAVVLLVIARVWPRLAQNQRITAAVAVLLISFVTFSFWPLLFSPFV